MFFDLLQGLFEFLWGLLPFGKIRKKNNKILSLLRKSYKI